MNAMQNTKRNPVKKPRKPKKNITHADLLMAMASAKKPNAKIEITIATDHGKRTPRKEIPHPNAATINIIFCILVYILFMP
jgi:hypothetical protein